MANWSDITIEIEGEKDKLIHALSILDIFYDNEEKHLVYKNNETGYYSSMIVESLSFNDYGIYIMGQGRWNGPNGLFKKIASELELSLYYYEEENGSDYTYMLKYDNGTLIDECSDSYHSQLRIDNIGLDLFIDDLSYWIESSEDLKECGLYCLLIENDMTEKEIKEYFDGVQDDADEN